MRLFYEAITDNFNHFVFCKQLQPFLKYFSRGIIKTNYLS